MNNKSFPMIFKIIVAAIVSLAVSLATISPAVASPSVPSKGGKGGTVAPAVILAEKCTTLTGPHYHAVDLCAGLGMPLNKGGEVGEGYPYYVGTASVASVSFKGYGKMISTTDITAMVTHCDGTYSFHRMDVSVGTSDQLLGSLQGDTSPFNTSNATAVTVITSWYLEWPISNSTWRYMDVQNFNLWEDEYRSFLPGLCATTK